MIMMLLPLLVQGWVLYTPYSRARAGIAYSDLGETRPGNDWSPTNNYSLHEISLVWGSSPTGFGEDGLGKSISFAIHPEFCTQLLPKFPEDGSRSGSIDGFVSFLSCSNLRAAIHDGLLTWSINSKHI